MRKCSNLWFRSLTDHMYNRHKTFPYDEDRVRQGPVKEDAGKTEQVPEGLGSTWRHLASILMGGEEGREHKRVVSFTGTQNPTPPEFCWIFPSSQNGDISHPSCGYHAAEATWGVGGGGVGTGEEQTNSDQSQTTSDAHHSSQGLCRSACNLTSSTELKERHSVKCPMLYRQRFPLSRRHIAVLQILQTLSLQWRKSCLDPRHGGLLTFYIIAGVYARLFL